MSLKDVAKNTLKIIEQNGFQTPSGRFVDISRDQKAAVAHTRLYRPEELTRLLKLNNDCIGSSPQVEVTEEKTQAAARRLVQDEGSQDLLLLNFASARNAGGGFLKGAKAQEEDVTRCSGLYPCLLTQPDYYAVNRRQSSLLYTDHIIYSPRVPFFRVKRYELLESHFLASVITAPAPNAGEVLRRDRDAGSQIKETLWRRAGMVLAVARDRGHRTLLLGAWGCGVFRNDPNVVAETFATWLAGPAFKGCFDRVVFGVYDPSKAQRNLQAFQQQFG